MSQQAQYITNLERALEGLMECFEENGKLRPTIEVWLTSDVLQRSALLAACEVNDATEDALAFANKIMYGDEALMEDEI